MKKLISLTIIVLIVLIHSTVFADSPSYLFYNYKVLDYRVIDGDTVEFTVDLGFNTFRKDSFRMTDYDAPETFRPKSKIEKVAGIKVKEYLQKVLDENKSTLFIRSDRKGKYRYLATIFTYKDDTVVNINQQVIDFMETNHLRKEDL